MLAARPTVAVEVPPPDPAAQASDLTTLRGWLVRRLLEEGYDVAADPARAHGVVHLRPASDGLVVEARGPHERRSFAVESGPDAVLRLEVLHRALMGVEQTCDATQALAAADPSLAVRFVGTAEHALLEAVAVAADDAQITLTARPQPGDTLACVERRGRLAEVALGPAEAECGLPLLVLDLGDDPPDAHRDAARTLVEAVRDSAPPTVSPDDDGHLDTRTLGGPPARDPLPALPPPARDDEFAPMQGPPRAEMRLGASIGVAVRGRALDPMVQAGWRMGRIRGLGGRLSASVVPSRGGSFQVTDARLVVGPDWEFGAGKRGHVDVALLVGTDLHAFSNYDRTAGDVAFAMELPVSYALSVAGKARLHVVVTPGYSTGGWSHRNGVLQGSELQWSRPRWRVLAGVAITHGWRIE